MKRTVWLWAPRAKGLAPVGKVASAHASSVRTSMPAELRLPGTGRGERLVEGDAGVVGGHACGAHEGRLLAPRPPPRPGGAPRGRCCPGDQQRELHGPARPAAPRRSRRDEQAETRARRARRPPRSSSIEPRSRTSTSSSPVRRASTSASPRGPAPARTTPRRLAPGATEGGAQGHDDDERQEEDEEEVGAVADDAQQVDAGDLEGGHQDSTSRRMRRQAEPAA